MDGFLEKCLGASDISFYVSNISNIHCSPIKKKVALKTKMMRWMLVWVGVSRLPQAPTEGVLSKYLFFKVNRWVYGQNISKMHVKKFALREKCSNTKLFLVRIFLYSDWIQISVFSPNTGKHVPEITPYFETFHAVSLLVKLHVVCLQLY